MYGIGFWYFFYVNEHWSYWNKKNLKQMPYMTKFRLLNTTSTSVKHCTTYSKLISSKAVALVVTFSSFRSPMPKTSFTIAGSSAGWIFVFLKRRWYQLSSGVTTRRFSKGVPDVDGAGPGFDVDVDGVSVCGLAPIKLVSLSSAKNVIILIKQNVK